MAVMMRRFFSLIVAAQIGGHVKDMSSGHGFPVIAEGSVRAAIELLLKSIARRGRVKLKSGAKWPRNRECERDYEIGVNAEVLQAASISHKERQFNFEVLEEPIVHLRRT